MSLNAYQACSFSEKRQVLSVFWQSKPSPSDKVERAAAQYGPWAVGLLAVIVLELLILLIVLVAMGHPVGWIAVVPGALAMFGLWRAVVRSRALAATA